jgi:uncharacterized protein YbjT (DUF2867 family)
MGYKKVIITGATGMVGGIALRHCLEREDVSEVTVFGRRSTGIKHEKLKEIIHSDYADFSAITGSLHDKDLALFCLGAYTGAVPDDEFRRITVDYTLVFAEALIKESPQAAFCLLSGQGADQSGNSRISFARYKGEAEKTLVEMDFPGVHLFRPGYIYPVTPRKEPNLMYRITRALYPFLHLVFPNMGVSSEALAKAMVEVGLNGRPDNQDPVMENKEIKIVGDK